MYQDSLKLFLPSFMILSLGIVFLWGLIRRRKAELRQIAFKSDRILKNIIRIDRIYKIFLLIMTVICFLFSYLPDYYNLFLPIKQLDIPIINGIGILMLKLSLIWIIVAQLFIDKELFEIRENITELNKAKLFIYSQKVLMSGLLMLFISFFVTISSIAAIVICIMAYLSYKMFMNNRNNHFFIKNYLF